jgi:hypothetical protein
MADRHLALARLDPLVRRWTAQPQVDGVHPARSEFAWTEDGWFLRQVTDRDQVPVGDPWRDVAPFPTVAMIGLDDSAGDFTMLYADARGVFRVYRMNVIGREWTIVRHAPGFNQRYVGTLSEDGDRVDGRWEASEDGQTWRVDFELNYTRQA